MIATVDNAHTCQSSVEQMNANSQHREFPTRRAGRRAFAPMNATARGARFFADPPDSRPVISRNAVFIIERDTSTPEAEDMQLGIPIRREKSTP